MTYQANYTLPSELMEQIALDGLEAVPEMIRIIIDMAMKAERQQYLGLGPYERSPERTDYANGYKGKTVTTRVGDITFAIPPSAQRGVLPQRAGEGVTQ
jgi:transposase-like protein